MRRKTATPCVAVGLTLAFIGDLFGGAPPSSSPMVADWPRFRGPRGDGICTETGLMQTVPAGGPRLLWKVDGIGIGYSTVSIAGGTIFTMGDIRRRTATAQFVIALDLNTRKERWSSLVGPPHKDGPRCTPTVDGDRVYALGTDGDLVCLETATGKLLWKKHMARDFGGKMMSVWKYTESPLVDGDRLICTPGAPDGTVVALNKKTGDVLWKCPVPALGPLGKDGAAYASAVVAEVEGVRQYITVVGRGAVGVEAATGRLLWGYNRIATRAANIPSPVVRGNRVFVTNGYFTGSALLELNKQGDTFSVKEVYFLGHRTFENHHGGVVLVGDHIYGGDGFMNGRPTCLNFKTGKIVWKVRGPGRKSAAVLYADGHLYCRYEVGGLMALIEATPEGYRLKGTFTPGSATGPGWPHPVIHNGRLYLRDLDTLMCYDVRR